MSHMSHALSDPEPSTVPTRRRERFSPSERHRRQLASKLRWANRNRERGRAKIRELCRLPRSLEKRRERYALRRQERLASGWVPNPRGRPRLQFASDEARAAHFRLKAHERYLARKARTHARSNDSAADV